MPGVRRSAFALISLLAAGAAPIAGPAAAQVQQYMLGPGSNVGSQTKVEPKNCITDEASGSITCDTQLINSPSDTPARPSYTPFGN